MIHGHTCNRNSVPTQLLDHLPLPAPYMGPGVRYNAIQFINKLMHPNNIISSQEPTFPPVWRITLLGISFASAHPSKKCLNMMTTRPHKFSSLYLLHTGPKSRASKLTILLIFTILIHEPENIFTMDTIFFHIPCNQSRLDSKIQLHMTNPRAINPGPSSVRSAIAVDSSGDRIDVWPSLFIGSQDL
jgi:hypothetical protein